MRILFVDDDVLAVRAISRELSRTSGVEVTGVTSAEEALSLLEVTPFDVVLSDFSMPGMDGVDFLQEALRLCPHARRLLLTGSPDDPKVVAALRADLADAILSKPVPPSVLRQAMGLPVRCVRRTTPRSGTPVM